jgi:hypothetical protein
MQFMADEQSALSLGDLRQTGPSLVPLPAYCRIAIETLTYFDRPPPLEGRHFHGARLHHTGILICRDFFLGLGRGRR